MNTLKIDNAEMLDLIEATAMLVKESEKFLAMEPNSLYFQEKVNASRALLGKLIKTKDE